MITEQSRIFRNAAWMWFGGYEQKVSLIDAKVADVALFVTALKQAKPLSKGEIEVLWAEFGTGNPELETLLK